MKCTQKSVDAGGKKGPYFVYIQDCVDSDPDRCVSFNVGETVVAGVGRDDGNCGFNRVTT